MVRGFFVLLFIVLSIGVRAQWTWVNPTPSGNTAEDVFFVNDQVGFVVKLNELIRTTDGGNTWTIASSFGGTDIVFQNQLGYIVGSGARVFKSRDTGATWAEVNTGSTEAFHSVSIIGADTVQLITETTLYTSVDGGSNWTSRPILRSDGSPVFVRKAVFTSSKIGHAVCTDGAIIKTTDGGTTWNAVLTSMDFPSDFYSVTFVNAQVGYASRQPDKMFRTGDGGNTWQEVASPGSAIYDIYFINEVQGFAAGENGGIYKTSDSGVTWSLISPLDLSAQPPSVHGVFFSDQLRGTAVGFRGLILRTIDGGVTWDSPSAFTYAPIRDILFTSVNTGYVFGDNIYKTTDQGLTWQALPTGLPDSVDFFDGEFISDNAGFATSEGKIVRTTDGGLTWSATTLDATSVSFVNTTTGYAGGGASIFKTVDGGVNWSPVTSFPTTQIKFISEDTGFSIHDSKLYKTIDGGVNWIEKYEVFGDMHAIYFVNNEVGFVAADNGFLLKTVDGGDSWTDLHPDFTDLLDVTFISENIGFVLGIDGKYYSTVDGGITWTTQTLPGLVQVLGTTSDKHIFAGGLYGALLTRTIVYDDAVLNATGVTSLSPSSISFSGSATSNAAEITDLVVEFGKNGVFDFQLALSPSVVEAGKSLAVEVTIPGLDPASNYSFRLRGTYQGTTILSNVLTFTTIPAFSLVLGDASSIKATEASVSALVAANFSAISNIVFQYDTTANFSKSAMANPQVVAGGTSANVSATLSDLKPDKEYHVRLKATLNGTEIFSEPKSFYTLPQYTISFLAPVEQGDQVRLSAVVTSNQFPITDLILEYGLRQLYDFTATPAPAGISADGVAQVDALISGLSKDSVYFYRLTGKYNNVPFTSEAQAFRMDSPFVVTVYAPIEVGLTSATLSGLIVPVNYAVNELHFEYGQNSNFGEEILAEGFDQFSPFSVLEARLGDLVPGTTYHFRLRANTNQGIIYSEHKVFRSDVVTSMEEEEMDRIVVYPNPATDKIQVRHGVDIRRITLTDAVGRTILQGEGNEQGRSIGVANLPRGVYFLLIESSDEKSIVRKVVLR